MKIKLLLAAVIALSLSAFAQTNSQTTMIVEPMAQTPIFRVNVISRSVQAVNYKHRSGATKLDFAGTDLMPSANGQAKVEQQARIHRDRSGIWQPAEAHDFRQ